jgi:ABC-type multidrug transport system fused ATPase/permease subunit
MKEIQKINKECVSNRILIARIIYLRLLSIVYLISFISLYYQIQGLWGNEGIVPANLFISNLKHNSTGYSHIISYPSITWLFNADSNSYQIENLLFILCLIGILFSLLIIFEYKYCFNFLGFSILWYIHYNFYFVGQTFMNFSWDELLLEIGFISIFFAPVNINGNKCINHITHINNIAFYLLKFILLKFMISSGINILSSKCNYWNSFNGLNFFFEGQPLLSSYSFFFHSYLSIKIKRIISAFGYFCMIYLPIGYFLVWRRFSIYAGQITFIFNLFLIFGGNYGYLNLLVIVLNVLNFDDYFFKAIIPNNILIYFKLDFLSPLIPKYIKELKEKRKIISEKENEIVEIKKELDEESEKEKNKKKIKELQIKYDKLKEELIDLVDDQYSDGPKIESTLKIESSFFNENYIFINFLCVNLILVYFFIYPINSLLKEKITIKNISQNNCKTIIIIFSTLIYLYIIVTIILNFANKIKNKLFSEKTIFSSTISDFIKDRNNKDKNVIEENSDDEDNEKEYKDEENEKDKKQMKLKNFLDIFKFIFNILKYFFVLIIFTIYFIGSVKYFLLNMDIAFFEEKVRNNKLANHLEKTNYGIYKYIIKKRF